MIWNDVVLFVVSVKDQVAITLNYYKNIVIHYLAIFSTKQHQVEINLLHTPFKN